MKPAANVMEEKINEIKFANPCPEIFANVTAMPENDSENIKKLLVKQIFSTVRWRKCN